MSVKILRNKKNFLVHRKSTKIDARELILIRWLDVNFFSSGMVWPSYDWIIYRGPGFLVVEWFNSLIPYPTPLPLPSASCPNISVFLCVAGRANNRKRWGRSLKGDSNEKKRCMGWIGDTHWVSVSDCGHRGLIAIITCKFCVKNLFPLPLAIVNLKGDVLANRQSGDRMFLSAIPKPIYWRI